MTRRSSTLTNAAGVDVTREIDSRYDTVKTVADKITEVETVANADLTQMSTDIQEILDFTDITVVTGFPANWDSVNKILTVEKGNQGVPGADGQDGAQGIEGQRGQQGDQGISVHHVKATTTTDPEGDFASVGELDTYTLYGDAAETINLGSFQVRNGLDLVQLSDAINVEFDKLEGIEENATRDQTGAEIKALYEAEADTNAFTDNYHSKLDGIEANAKDDQNASEVPFTPVGAIAATDVQSAIVEVNNDNVSKSGGTMTGDLTVPNIITSGNVDGRDVSVDGTKLDGIEPNATADQTGAEIKVLYEAEANTNAFTDVQVSKLSGIEANAKDDQVASEVPFTPVGTVTATDVQSAISELDSDIVALGNPVLAPYSARNCVLNQEAVSQGQSQRIGMESLLGTATSAVITSGGDFGYLRWSKDRNNVENHYLSDSVRGDFYLSSNNTAAEVATVPVITADDVTWTFQTTHKTSGVTNRNKAYTTHYNPHMGFSVVGYEGDGNDGHEVPTHLPKKTELLLGTQRNEVRNWLTQSPLFAEIGDFLLLQTTNALSNDSSFSNTIFEEGSVKYGSGDATNKNGGSYIAYHFHSVQGVSKIGKYVGTGEAGNYVDCGFKVGWLLVKNLTTGSTNWMMIDSSRGVGDDNTRYLLANSSSSENLGVSAEVAFSDEGFSVINTGGSDLNASNNEYLFMAFADNSGTTGRTEYDYPTTKDTLSIKQDSLISFANGFNVNGPVDSLEQVGAGVTHTLGTGYENKTLYLYKDAGGSYGTTEFRPLEGLTRNSADRWGVESPSDPSLRTTARHTNYVSSTGVTLASGESASGFEAYRAFNKDANDVIGTNASWSAPTATASWLQYKFNEKRVLKSWRMRESSPSNLTPRRFTIEGSNDGLNWAAIDSSYTASDYIGNGADLWGDIQDTSGNTSAYTYLRINITTNNGNASFTEIAELEFNTVLPTDYFNVVDGKSYDKDNNPIQRVYLAKVITDDVGGVSFFENFPVSISKLQDTEVFGDLEIHGDIVNSSIIGGYVIFNAQISPPLIIESKNVDDVILQGTGAIKVLANQKLNLRKAVPVPINGNNYHSLIGTNHDDIEENSVTLAIRSSANTPTNPTLSGIFFIGGLRKLTETN